MFTGKDVVVLGMMIFALFLGAGNIIFPPMEGFTAGTHWATASLGFVLTGVLMPFITLVVVAVLGRGEALTRDLPKWAEVLFLATLYLIFGHRLFICDAAGNQCCLRNGVAAAKFNGRQRDRAFCFLRIV